MKTEDEPHEQHTRDETDQKSRRLLDPEASKLQSALKTLELLVNIKKEAVGKGPVAGSLATIQRYLNEVKRELLKIRRYEQITNTVIIMHDDGTISRKSKHKLFEEITDDKVWEDIIR